ncbi:MAG: metallophosphoesterase [Lentisphaeria bacterium]|nr:metallophosphoesterase [Lentisphaeria bacterium]
MLMMALYALLTAALIIYRIVAPLKIRTRWKVLLSLPILAACCKSQLVYLFGGPMFFAPDLPGPLLVAAGWCYASALLLFFMLLGLEAVRLAVRFVFFCRTHQAPPESCRKFFLRFSLGLIPVAMLLAGFGLYRGLADPAVRELRLVFPNLPPGSEGLRIVVLADLHAHRIIRAPQIRRMVDTANALKPDLTLLVGDYVDGTVAQRGAELVPLRLLRAKYGVFGVPGNHEYYSVYPEWRKYLTEAGIRLLENRHEQLPGGIYLAGVTDPAAYRMGGAVPDLEKALLGIPAGSFVLLLAHRPDGADRAARKGVSLQLSGHTHGGMVRGLDFLVAQFNGGFVSGLYEVGGMKLYVSNGSGIWNGFPIRLGREAEITLVTLTSK